MFIKATCDGQRCYVNSEYIVDVFENENDPNTFKAYTSATESEYIIDRKQFELIVQEAILIESVDMPDISEQLWAQETGIIMPTKINIRPVGGKKNGR